MAKQPRGKVTQLQILTAAAELFDRSGFHGVTTGEIATAAGVTKGTMHFHFGGKEELAAAIIEEQHCRSIALVDLVTTTDATALEQIVMLSHALGLSCTSLVCQP